MFHVLKHTSIDFFKLSFWKKAFIFQKICFKVKVLKTFKVSTDCYIKT